MLEVGDLAGGYWEAQVKMTLAWAKVVAVGMETCLDSVVIGEGTGLDMGVTWKRGS